MTDSHPTDPVPERTGADKERTAKKPYQKPAFQHERVFETMALSCGKIHANQAQCKFHRKAS